MQWKMEGDVTGALIIGPWALASFFSLSLPGFDPEAELRFLPLLLDSKLEARASPVDLFSTSTPLCWSAYGRIQRARTASIGLEIRREKSALL